MHPPPPPTAPAPGLVEPPQRLHPISMVRGIQLRSIVPAFGGLVFLGSEFGRWTPVVVLGLFVVFAVVRFLLWQRHTYELTGTRVVERQGLLSRSERALEMSRIQQVDVQRNLLDRAVGTAELRLETASDAGESEITLAVVTLAEADRLRARLEEVTRAARVARRAPQALDPAVPGVPAPPAPADLADEEEEELLVAVPLSHVALAAVTGRRLLLLPAGLAVLLGMFDDIGLFDRASDVAGEVTVRLGLLGLTAAILGGAAAALVVTAVAGILRDGNWTLTSRGDALRVRRGLTTERTATVPRRRVQRVSVDRSWLRGQLGFASVTIHSAGGVGGEGGSATEQLDRSLTVPLLPEAGVDALLAQLLSIEDHDRPVLEPHPRRAGVRATVRGAGGTVFPAVGLAAAAYGLAGQGFGPAWLLWVLAGLLPVGGALAGYRRHTQRASGLSDRLVASRTGLIGTSTVLTPRGKVQGATTVSSPFQRRRRLANLEVHVAGPSGGVTLLDLDDGDADRLRTQLAG